MKWSDFSFDRFKAIIFKEFIQIRRDRLTFAMMIGIPIIQLTLFGFAINTNPKNLPTSVVVGDTTNSIIGRSILQSLKNSEYFKISDKPVDEKEAKHLLETGAAQFVVTIPPNFTRDFLRGARPSLLVEIDATDPAATSNAVSALLNLNQGALDHDLKGALAFLKPADPFFNIEIHRNYNPEIITQYNIVPALMGVILTMTMIMMTGIAITRERERGTMENLLSTPVHPLEVMFGKIVPYILVGYIQVAIVLLAANYIFDIPLEGSIILLLFCILVFVAANLSVGIMFSTIAKNQMQAMQMTFFFFLPSILLSGFMFPFRGMPDWAQAFGEILPLTHFLRIVRGILLKGNGLNEIAIEIFWLFVFMAVVILLGYKRYHRTLD